MSIETLLVRFGPAAMVAGSALEGDLTPVLAGVVAHLGLVPLPVAMVASAAGILGGDLLWFAIGRRAGPRLRGTRAWRRVGPAVERLAGRFGPAEIALARVVYGSRNVSMLFWGAQGLPLGRFLAVDAPVAVAWAVLLVALGHAASGGAKAVLGDVERVERWLLGAAVAGAAVLLVRRRLLARRGDAAHSARRKQPTR